MKLDERFEELWKSLPGSRANRASARALFDAGVAAERERCAKLAESYARDHNDIRRAALEVLAENLRMEPSR